VPGFEQRYLSVGHFPESWYSQFHQLDMAVELVSSSRAATRAYFRHFLSHWSYDKDLITDAEMEIYRLQPSLEGADPEPATCPAARCATARAG
jgi:hypothetical protein